MTHAWWNLQPSARAGGLRTLTAALLAAGVLTACGGDDDDDKAPAEPPVTEQPAPGPAQPISRAMDLTILHINDQHSNLDAKTGRKLSLAGADGVRREVTVDAGGFPRVTAAFKELAEGRPNLLKLHAGDALTGTLYFNRAGPMGKPDADMMNTVCFDTFTLGNHEFDKGDTELKTFIERLQTNECKTPAISANVKFGENSALNPAKSDLVKPYVVVQRDEQPIGIVGLTVAEKTKTASSPDADTTFESELTAAQRAIDELTAQGVNKIVIASHIGYGLDKTLIPQLKGVDVVVGGDSHTLLGPDSMNTDYKVGTTGGTYAEALKNADGDTTCLVQAWEYSQIVGELNVKFDDQGRVTECAGTPHVLIGDNFKVGGADPSAADLTAFKADVAASGFLRITQPDAAATAVLKPFADEIAEFKVTNVALATTELCSRRVPGGIGSIDYTRSSASCTTLGEVNRRGGDIQQLVAQAYVEVANANYGGADISLQSGGGVREPLAAGEVTAATVISVLPFGNMLYRLDITGAEARGMVEDGLDGVFKATGGDGYTTLANVPAERRTDIGILDSDVFQSYIDSQTKDTTTGLPQLNKLADDLYSTRTFIDKVRAGQ